MATKTVVIRTVWEECLNRDRCRLGLAGVWVRTIAFNGRSEVNDFLVRGTLWGAGGELIVITHEGFKLPAAECLLIEPWPIVCCRPLVRHRFNAVTPATRKRILERDGHRCVLCGSTDVLQIDHLFPVSKGGKDKDRNLRVLCKPCNLRKGAREE